ncbi:hypothetical protein LX32DRAFT_431578 [Colletotrichum zoysiae]|uniref:Uncharacterized protein n=1 Tax=Colletotrichum zoysiae TaxID=1216348 RepID=A0AAD9HF66_9PEZI|nr:hypothetical protein LX32DRAFT_431578 [Colletotrichum zoysiae]
MEGVAQAVFCVHRSWKVENHPLLYQEKNIERCGLHSRIHESCRFRGSASSREDVETRHGVKVGISTREALRSTQSRDNQQIYELYDQKEAHPNSSCCQRQSEAMSRNELPVLRTTSPRGLLTASHSLGGCRLCLAPHPGAAWTRQLLTSDPLTVCPLLVLQRKGATPSNKQQGNRGWSPTSQAVPRESGAKDDAGCRARYALSQAPPGPIHYQFLS